MVSPAELHPDANDLLVSEALAQRSEYLRLDVSELLGCDGVALLQGWENSAGAIAEVHLALELGMPIFDSAVMIPYRKSAIWSALFEFAKNGFSYE